MAMIDEFLSVAEYVVTEGKPRVILCERGIRAFEAVGRELPRSRAYCSTQ